LLAGARASDELPNDPALPALLAIRALGLAAAIPALALEGFSAEFALRGYTSGSRATLEVRTEERRFAVKAYAEDPAPEAELYTTLADAGLTGDAPVRVPSLLAWNRELRVLAIGWLEGPTAKELIERGQGKRAGELVARWVQRAVSLPVKFGRPLGAAQIMHKARDWAATIVGADPALGQHATALAELLALTQPKENAPRLLHGTLYSRHVLDLGDGAGLIDWDRFGQGPLELDAGIFLASTWQLGVRRESLASEVAQVEAAFLAGTAGLLDQRALAWHRAAMLLRLANKIKHRPSDSSLARAAALLAEAARLAEATG
jgi:hypothetical protein